MEFCCFVFGITGNKRAVRLASGSQVDRLRDVSDEQLDAALSVGTDVLWLQGGLNHLTTGLNTPTLALSIHFRDAQNDESYWHMV